jgi:hypothetical protein
MSIACVICSKKGSYKCPKCLVSYCSVVCCKMHKESCSERAICIDPVSSSSSSNPQNAIPVSEVESEVSILQPDGNITKKETLPSNSARSLLTEEQKENLRKCKYLTDSLKSKRLRDTITSIDSAEDRLAALRKLTKRDPAFHEFTVKLKEGLSTSHKK